MDFKTIIVTLLVLIVVVVVASLLADTNRFRDGKTKDTFRTSKEIGKTNIGGTKKAMDLTQIVKERNLSEGNKMEPKMPKGRATKASTTTAIEVMTKKGAGSDDS